MLVNSTSKANSSSSFPACIIHVAHHAGGGGFAPPHRAAGPPWQVPPTPGGRPRRRLAGQAPTRPGRRAALTCTFCSWHSYQLACMHSHSHSWAVPRTTCVCSTVMQASLTRGLHVFAPQSCQAALEPYFGYKPEDEEWALMSVGRAARERGHRVSLFFPGRSYQLACQSLTNLYWRSYQLACMYDHDRVKYIHIYIYTYRYSCLLYTSPSPRD